MAENKSDFWAETWKDYHLCELRFTQFEKCSEANEMIKICRQRKDELLNERKELTYQKVKEDISKAKTLNDYEKILYLLMDLKEYKDSNELLVFVNKKIRLLHFKPKNIIKKIRTYSFSDFAPMLISIALLVGIVIIIASSVSSSAPNKDGDVCGICGGDGVVTSKMLGTGSGIQEGFDTYYRCKGCNGTGRD